MSSGKEVLRTDAPRMCRNRRVSRSRGLSWCPGHTQNPWRPLRGTAYTAGGVSERPMSFWTQIRNMKMMTMVTTIIIVPEPGHVISEQLREVGLQITLTLQVGTEAQRV